MTAGVLAGLGALTNLGGANCYYYDGRGFAVLGLVFPIATPVLALLPSTTAWIQSRPNPVMPQYYPPYPG